VPRTGKKVPKFGSSFHSQSSSMTCDIDNPPDGICQTNKILIGVELETLLGPEARFDHDDTKICLAQAVGTLVYA
jgi:hypothetical protein